MSLDGFVKSLKVDATVVRGADSVILTCDTWKDIPQRIEAAADMLYWICDHSIPGDVILKNLNRMAAKAMGGTDGK